MKAFFWSSADTEGKPRLLYVEREEPSGTSTVLAIPPMYEGRNYVVLIRGVEDFQVRDDFMFATKRVDKVSTYWHILKKKKNGFVIMHKIAFSFSKHRGNMCTFTSV